MSIGRQVVDHEEAEVLEHVRGLGAAGAGHAGDDRDVERVSVCGWHGHVSSIVAPEPARPGARSGCVEAVEAPVDGRADGVGQPREREQVLLGQLPELLDRADLLQQALLAARARARRPRRAPTCVIFLPRSWRW